MAPGDGAPLLVSDPVRRARIHEMRSRWALHPANPAASTDEALEEARKALALLGGVEAPPAARFSALETLARVFIARGRRRSALALLRKALRTAREEGITGGRTARVERLYAELARKGNVRAGRGLAFTREEGARFL